MVSEEMKPPGKYLPDISITFAASSVTLGLGFLLSILIARLLGAADLGLYRMTTTLFSIIILVAGIGLPVAVVKYAAELKEDKQKSGRLVSTSATFSLIVGILVILMMVATANLFARVFKMEELGLLLMTISLSIPFSLVGAVLLGYLNGIRMMKMYSIAMIVQSCAMFAVSSVFLALDLGILGIILGVVLSSIVFCVLLLLVTRKSVAMKPTLDIPVLKSIVSFGSRIVSINGVNQVNYYADTILIGFFLSTRDLGFYGAAIGLSRVFWIIPQAVQTVSFPVTAEYWSKGDRYELQTMIDKFTRYTACILFPLGLLVGLFAGDIMSALYGADFRETGMVLVVLVIGATAFGILTSVGGTLQAIGKTNLALAATIVTAVVDIALNLALIPRFGTMGAAIATTISLISITVMFFYLILKASGVRINLFWQMKMASLFTVVLAANYLSPIQWSALPAILWTGFVCAIVLFLLSPRERRLLLAGILRKSHWATP